MNDHELLMQVAIFAAEFCVPEDFDGGQVEWIEVIIEEAKKFCNVHANTDWSERDWYLTSDSWMNKIMENYK